MTNETTARLAAEVPAMIDALRYAAPRMITIGDRRGEPLLENWLKKVNVILERVEEANRGIKTAGGEKR
jgi:hypothetical protein